MRIAQAAVVAASALMSTVVAAPLAYAAPTSNDTYNGRVVIGSLPYSSTIDTSEASTDADDTEFNAGCGAPSTDASVWFEVTAPSDGALIAEVSDSDYTAGMIVASGTPGDWTFVDCGADFVGWNTVAGETYTILVVDDQYDRGGNGGTLTFTVQETPPTPTIEATVDPFAALNAKDGTLTVTGTVTCTGEAETAGLFLDLKQQVGRGFVYGTGDQDVECDGVTKTYAVTVTPHEGRFAGGKTQADSWAQACNRFDCTFEYQQHTIKVGGR